MSETGLEEYTIAVNLVKMDVLEQMPAMHTNLSPQLD